MKNITVHFLFFCAVLTSSHLVVAQTPLTTPLFNRFVDTMTDKHQFNVADIRKLFKQVVIQPNIINTMNKPAEGLAWHKYRKIFMTSARISGGVKFWQDHQHVLAAVEVKYGVPAAIIVAIIGVETNYGSNTGHHRVIDALATLGFAYPKRSAFFLSELENFLVLCRDENINPLHATGSYAGAMGVPQFMPSSFRAYAADFEQDGKRDIWNNPSDAIASVANYLAKHDWRKGDAVAFQVLAQNALFQQALTKGLKPDRTWAQLQALAITSKHVIDADEAVKLLAYTQETGDDLWIGLHNFYVITRYNHSALYAMAVYQLSDAINEHRNNIR